jgi:chorismate mutase/prephenate dehydratase
MAARRKDAAAICAPEVARRYGLHILRYPLLPERPNRTSFFILGRARRAPLKGAAEAWKVSLAVSLPHKPGALYRTLGILAARRLNMTRIESRPLPDQPWEYKFFIEFEGGLDTPAVQSALKALNRHAHSVQVLGNYAVRHLTPNG